MIPLDIWLYEFPLSVVKEKLEKNLFSIIVIQAGPTFDGPQGHYRNEPVQT